MIEAVSTLSVQSSGLRSQPQNAIAVISAESVERPQGSFINSRVRVDNLMDVAILEFRNSGGEVIRQYPSKAQLRWYERAAELKDSSRSDTPTVAVEEGDGEGTSVSVDFTSSPAPSPSPAPSSALAASGGQGFGSAAVSVGSTSQSIVV